MTEPPEPTNHKPPRQRRRTHHTEEEIPEFRKADLPRRHVLAAVAVRDVDVDRAGLEDGPDTVRTHGQEPALVLRQTVATQQHPAVVLVVTDGQLGRLDIAVDRQRERGHVQPHVGQSAIRLLDITHIRGGSHFHLFIYRLSLISTLKCYPN